MVIFFPYYSKYFKGRKHLGLLRTIAGVLEHSKLFLFLFYYTFHFYILYYLPSIIKIPWKSHRKYNLEISIFSIFSSNVFFSSKGLLCHTFENKFFLFSYIFFNFIYLFENIILKIAIMFIPDLNPVVYSPAIDVKNLLSFQ